MSEVVGYAVGEIGEDVWARPVGRGGLPPAAGGDVSPNVKRPADRDVHLWELEQMYQLPAAARRPWTLADLRHPIRKARNR